MKVFKTEKIVYFKTNHTSKTELNKITPTKPKINYINKINKFFFYKEDFSQKFLKKKLNQFEQDKLKAQMMEDGL